jgi:phage terminase large subunit-like protein
MASKNPNVDAAIKWARRVVKGQVPACKYIVAACQRHFDDVAASRTAAFIYKFDASAAERKIDFVQLLPHTKGEWALQRKRLELEDWQKFGLAMCFGWVKKRTGLRRFSEAYWEVPRKNGKSVIASGTGLAMFAADSEFGAEVYSGATTEKQAWEVFRPARLMAQRTPQLLAAAGIEVNASNIAKPADGSRFEPIIGNPGDGASPSCAIVDEYHEHDTAALYDTMLTGMGARRQPLMFIITTAGSNVEGPCYDMRSRVIAMLDKSVPDDELWGWIWTIDEGDDWTDPRVLAKANPNIDISVYQEYLESQQRKAVKNASFQNTFKTKHLNVWVSARSVYFNMQAFAKCADTSLKWADFAGQACLMPIDLASKTDICCRLNLFYRYEDDGRLHYYSVNPQFYLPNQTIEYGTERDVVERYQKWVNKGLLTAHDGAEVSFNGVRDDLLVDAADVALTEVPMDEWGGFQLAQDLTDAGHAAVKIPKNTKTFSPAMKELNAAILSGRFHHDGNPILAWMMGNVTAKVDANDNVFPRKEKSSKKIDGAVALMMAVGRAMVLGGTSESESVFFV